MEGYTKLPGSCEGYESAPWFDPPKNKERNSIGVNVEPAMRKRRGLTSLDSDLAGDGCTV